MAKETSYNEVRNISINLRLNDIVEDEDGKTGFVPARVITTMHALTSDGAVREVQKEKVIGFAQDTPYTAAELVTKLRGTNNSIGKLLTAQLERAYINALGDNYQDVVAPTPEETPTEPTPDTTPTV